MKEQEIFESYGQAMEEHDLACSKRIAKRMKIARRILEPRMYTALEYELADTDGVFDAYFTRNKNGNAQEAITDLVELEVFVDQQELYCDCYHGVVYFPINKAHWLALEYDC